VLIDKMQLLSIFFLYSSKCVCVFCFTFRWIFVTSCFYLISGNFMAYTFFSNGSSRVQSALLKSPNFTVGLNEGVKVEFFYNIHQQTLNNLKLSVKADGDVTNVWQSGYLRREEREKWLYQCVSVPSGQLSTVNSKYT